MFERALMLCQTPTKKTKNQLHSFALDGFLENILESVLLLGIDLLLFASGNLFVYDPPEVRT